MKYQQVCLCYGLLWNHILCQQFVWWYLCQLRTSHVGFYYWFMYISELYKLMWIQSRLIEIPAYLCGLYSTDKFGRRATVGIGFVGSGLACLITGLVPEGNYLLIHIIWLKYLLFPIRSCCCTSGILVDWQVFRNRGDRCGLFHHGGSLSDWI